MGGISVQVNAGHQRRKEGVTKAALAAKGSGSVASADSQANADPKRKKLNLQTYKYHALADYPGTIRRFGTTDNYNTQTVCSFSFQVW